MLSNAKQTFAQLLYHAHSEEAMGHSAITHLSREGERRIWYDWCVIRQANVVYYTPSGFSESALYFPIGVHMMKQVASGGLTDKYYRARLKESLIHECFQ